jgi:hypothetical protein
MKPRAITAYAIIKKDKNKLDVLEIYSSEDVVLGKDEKIVKVKIEVVE